MHLSIQSVFAHCCWNATNGVLDKALAAVDGVVLKFEHSTGDCVESANHPGYKNRPGIELLIVVAMDGSIWGARWADGSTSDPYLWNGLEALALDIHRHSHETEPVKVLGDSIFANSRILEKVTDQTSSSKAGIMKTIRCNSVIGIGGLPMSMRRLRVPLPSDDPWMADTILINALRFTNYRIRYCRCGQLATMFSSMMAMVQEE